MHLSLEMNLKSTDRIADYIQYKDVEKVIAKVPKYELFEMKGVSEESVYDVILKKGKEMNLKSTDRIADYIRAYPERLQMCRDPALMELVLEVRI